MKLKRALAGSRFRSLALYLGVAMVLVPSSGLAKSPWPSLDRPATKVGGGEGDVALVVSIEEYAVLPPIAGAERNAKAWTQWLEKTRGVKASRIVHLKNKEGTPSEMLAKARELADLVEPAGRVWFVFIGHGAPAEDQSEGILVGWSAQETARNLYDQSLRQSAIVEALGGGRRSPITLVVDACFNGKSRSGSAIAEGLQPVLLIDRSRTVPDRVTLLSAGRGDQFAGPLPGEARPAFSYLLLGALRGWADDPGYGDGDGFVTVSEALTFTRSALTATLKGRSQTPEAAGAVTGVLSQSPRESPPDLSTIRDTVDVGGGLTVSGGGERIGGGAGDVGRGMNLELDLAGLQEAENLSKAVRDAKAKDVNPNLGPIAKAEAWEGVAKLTVKGKNSYADEARANARSWREVALLAGTMREDWRQIREALKLEVVEIDKKKDLVSRFLETYDKLSTEAEYGEALQAGRALARGEALPSIGGAASRSALEETTTAVVEPETDPCEGWGACMKDSFMYFGPQFGRLSGAGIIDVEDENGESTGSFSLEAEELRFAFLLGFRIDRDVPVVFEFTPGFHSITIKAPERETEATLLGLEIASLGFGVRGFLAGGILEAHARGGGATGFWVGTGELEAMLGEQFDGFMYFRANVLAGVTIIPTRKDFGFRFDVGYEWRWATFNGFDVFNDYALTNSGLSFTGSIIFD